MGSSSRRWDFDMTDQTARAEDDAAVPTEAAAPAPSTALEREHADMKDRLLRTLAEMENLRKRTEREIADSRLYSVASFARDMLTVADNLRRQNFHVFVWNRNPRPVPNFVGAPAELAAV